MKRFLIFLFCAALFMRVAMLLFLVFADPRGDEVGVFSSDSSTYFQVVDNILHHGVFSMSTDSMPAPDNYRTPGYIFFLYPFVRFGVAPVWIAFAQSLIASVAVVIFYFIARKVFSDRVSVIAAVLYALEPFTARAANLLTATALFASLFPLVPLLLVWYIKDGNRRTLFTASVLLALCALVKPVAYVFFPWLIVAVLLREFSWRSLFFKGLPVLAVFFIIVFPWILRNKTVLGTWEFSSVTDYVIYDVNAQLFQNFLGAHDLVTSGLINAGYSNTYLSQANMVQLRESGISYIMRQPFHYALFHAALVPRLFIQDQYLDIFQKKGSNILPPGLDLYTSFIRLNIRKIFSDIAVFIQSPWFLVYIAGKIFWISIFLLMIGSVWFLWGATLLSQKFIIAFLLLFVLYYGFAISPVTRAGHRVPINILVFLLATSSLIALRDKKYIFNYEA